MKGRRPALPPNKTHRDRKNDYKRQPKHKDKQGETEKPAGKSLTQ